MNGNQERKHEDERILYVLREIEKKRLNWIAILVD